MSMKFSLDVFEWFAMGLFRHFIEIFPPSREENPLPPSIATSRKLKDCCKICYLAPYLELSIVRFSKFRTEKQVTKLRKKWKCKVWNVVLGHKIAKQFFKNFCARAPGSKFFFYTTISCAKRFLQIGQSKKVKTSPWSTQFWKNVLTP